MAIEFRKANRRQVKARIGIVGPSGSGKTYTALVIARELGRNVFLIDSENRSADMYADEFDFAKCDLTSFRPRVYVEAIRAAEAAGADVIVVDSLSHAWAGSDGALSLADEAMVRYKGNKFAAWRDVTPEHNALVDAIVRCRAHIICTMRAKTAYELEKDEQGKVVPRKIGLAPVQRDGMEYEFDLVADMDHEHNFVVSKSRIRILDKAVIRMPDGTLGRQIREWLETGVPEEPEQAMAAGQGTAPDPVPAPPGSELAAEADVKAVYHRGHRELGLSPARLKALLVKATGRDSTEGLTVGELQRWQQEIESAGNKGRAGFGAA